MTSPGASGTASLLKPGGANARSTRCDCHRQASRAGTVFRRRRVTVPSRRACPVLSYPLPTFRAMRLQHTSDWHIGRSLHGTDLLAEQEAVLSGLASVVVAESVDAVLVAGDVYDRAVPSADATAVLDRVVERLLKAGAAVVMTPGNHDSA